MADVEVVETTKVYTVDDDGRWDHTNTWWYKFAVFLDCMRIVPRGLMAAYGYTFWLVTTWYMALPDPSGAQSAFVSTVVGAGAVWFGIYVNTKPAESSANNKKSNKGTG